MIINRACVILWVILFAVGMLRAMHKPLWCDELYGQTIAVEGGSWGKILTGRAMDETYNFPPLYYAIQKAITSVIKVSLPDDMGKDFELPAINRKYNILVYPRGQILLRVLPDAFMTTAIVFLVRFFWIREGIMVGLMALLSALSTWMVWWYWVEARPYSLWFLLSLLQAVFLIEILSGAKNSSRINIYLVLCHWLLALTATLWYIQVIIAQAVLFSFGKRDFRYHFWGGILPFCFGLIFLSNGSHSTFYIAMSSQDIIKFNFSFEQAALIFFYLMAFFCRSAWINKNNAYRQKIWKGLVHLPSLFLGLCFSIMVLIYVHWCWPVGHERIAIYARHFFFLSALSVVMVPAMFGDLWSRSRGSPFWRGCFLVLFIVLLFSQLIEAFTNAWFNGFYY